MAWEIWHLQHVIVAWEAGSRSTNGLRHREDIIDQAAKLREYVAAEPCLNEALAVWPGARRGGQK